MTLPTFFIGHGSPMNAIENNRYTDAWILAVKRLPKPKAILVISAHWETDGSKITSNEIQKTIQDFYGFPKKLFDVEYEPRGNADLAKRIQKLAPEIQLDDSWGLDHGAWSVLLRTYPLADVPTIQLSLDKNKSPREHYELAKKLQILRGEGVLIIGSGNIVHNLRMMQREAPPEQAFDWTVEFDETVADWLAQGRLDELQRFERLGSVARMAHPSHEHFLPLLYAAGAVDKGESCRFMTPNYQLASVAMRSVVWGQS